MASWASNIPTDGAPVTVPDMSPASNVADLAVTPPMGVGFWVLSPGL